MALGPDQEVSGQGIGAADLESDLLEQKHLVEEPRIDPRGLEELIDLGAAADRLLEIDQSMLGGRAQRLHEGGGLLGVGSPTVPMEDGALLVERAHRLLEGLGERPADGHGLADRLHGGGQRRVRAAELLEGGTRNLDDDVVEGGLEGGRRRTGDVVGDLIERIAHGQTRRDLGDREAGGLGGQG